MSLLGRRSLPSTLQPYGLGLRLNHKPATESTAAVTVTATSPPAGVVFDKTLTRAVEQGVAISNIPVVAAGPPTIGEGELDINSIKQPDLPGAV